MLKAKLETDRLKHVEAKLCLDQQREQLLLETEIAKAAAEERVYLVAEGEYICTRKFHQPEGEYTSIPKFHQPVGEYISTQKFHQPGEYTSIPKFHQPVGECTPASKSHQLKGVDSPVVKSRQPEAVDTDESSQDHKQLFASPRPTLGLPLDPRASDWLPE